MYVPLIVKGINVVQNSIQREQLDGWLFYHYNDVNCYAMNILSLKRGEVSRQTFYFIPVRGEPVKIVHDVEETVLDHLPGSIRGYVSQENLRELLREIVGKKRVAIEYSQDIPLLSRVDGGMVDLLRKLDIEIFSSSGLIVELFSRLTDKQLEQQKTAALLLDEIQLSGGTYAMKNLEKGIYERDLQDYLLERMDRENLLTVGLPICAAGKNSAFPHYTVRGRGDKLRKDQVLMIDSWCKLDEEGSVYADLTKMFYLGMEADSLLAKRYALVYEATKRCITLVRDRMKQGRVLRGYEVDQQTINYFNDNDQLKYCRHRTGHCIDQNVHGDYGAHFDCFEMKDTREVTNISCYAIEPALYFKGEYGIRLESNIVIDKSRNVEVRGASAPSIITGTTLI